MAMLSVREIGALLLPQLLFFLLWLIDVKHCRVFCLEVAYFYCFSCIVELKSGRQTHLQWSAIALVVSLAVGFVLGHVFTMTANAHACAAIFVTFALTISNHRPSKAFAMKSLSPCILHLLLLILSLMFEQLNFATMFFVYGCGVFIVFSAMQYVDDHLPYRSLEINFVKCVASFAIIVAIEVFCPKIRSRFVLFPVLEFFRSGLNLCYHPRVNQPADDKGEGDGTSIIQKAIGAGMVLMYVLLQPQNLNNYIYVVIASIAWKFYQLVVLKNVSRT